MQIRDRFHSALRRIYTTAPDAQRVDVGIIDVGSTLDHQAAERMKKRLKKFAAEGRRRHIVDLTRLDALDSCGLAGLISALRAVRETGGTVHLVANTSRVTHILELTSMTRLFKVHPSMQQALASN